MVDVAKFVVIRCQIYWLKCIDFDIVKALSQRAHRFNSLVAATRQRREIKGKWTLA